MTPPSSPPTASPHTARRRAALLLALGGALACGETLAPSVDPIPLVDPLIGTGGVGFSVGSIAPGPTHPFGLAKPSPDTSERGGAPGFNHCAGYYWYDSEIRAFSQLHLEGTGVPDYGALAVMPARALPTDRVTEAHYRARFDHRDEVAKLGRYQVLLREQGITARVAATPRTSLYRFDYAGAEPASIVLYLDHALDGGRTLDGAVQYDGDRGFEGWLLHAGPMSGRHGGFHLYFVGRLDRTPSRVDGLYGREVGTSTQAARSGLVLRFEGGGTLQLQLGLSFVDVETARENLDAEWMDFDLDRAEAETEAAWRPILSKVEIPDHPAVPPSVLRRFYTALHHVFHMPTRLSESGGKYKGFDKQTHRASGFTYYSDFSLWDTFRTTHPLLALLAPSVQADMNRSILDMRAKGGFLPRWPLATGYTWTMLGNHGETMLIDAARKGVTGFDVESVFQDLVDAASGPRTVGATTRAARECWDDYASLGYCTSGHSGSVSRTLENALNDWVLGTWARTLGHEDAAARLLARAEGWKRHFDPGTGFLRPLDAGGAFTGEFSAEFHGPDYIEGNARQYTLYPYQDLAGLTQLVGGTEAMNARLLEMFEKAEAEHDPAWPNLWYWHGNEPSIHVPYYMTELGRPDLTHRFVRSIMDELYPASPEGFAGNDDGGTLSAWYVFSALGLFPKAGTDEYWLGAPRFPEARIRLESGRTLRIVAEGYAEDAIYVDEVRLDGRRLAAPIVRHADLVAAEALVFRMSKAPNRGTFAP